MLDLFASHKRGVRNGLWYCTIKEEKYVHMLKTRHAEKCRFAVSVIKNNLNASE